MRIRPFDRLRVSSDVEGPGEASSQFAAVGPVAGERKQAVDMRATLVGIPKRRAPIRTGEVGIRDKRRPPSVRIHVA
jgi:hypothetical protein